MATSQIASMLDELMGRNRNVAPNEKVREIQWWDPEICRYYIVQFCPHDLFTNTKADLGPCPKIHDEELKRKFSEEKRDNYRKIQYIDDFLRFCQRMLSELQTRIKKAKERLLLTQQENGLIPGGSGANKDVLDKINMLSDKINNLVEEAETAGCQGNVEQAQGLMKLCDQLREERDELRNSITPNVDYNTQQKAMEVCDVCGAFLIVGDAQQRIDDHLLGKQHVGYARLRAVTDKITEERRKWREERDREAEERRRQRMEEEEKLREKKPPPKEHEPREKNGKSRRTSRSRSRSRRSRSRNRRGRRSKSPRDRLSSKSRERERAERRHKHRSRSKDSKRRSRSKEAKRRSRSRDSKRRSRSRDSKRRSRSRESNRRRSRSKEVRRRRSSGSRDRGHKGGSRKRSRSRKRRSRSRHRSPSLKKEGEPEHSKDSK